MPAAKRRARSPTDDWTQLRLFVRSPEQELYEALRPIVLFGRLPAVRAQETGVPERTLRRKADAFDQHGMASLFATLPGFAPAEELREDDRRQLPAGMRQFILNVAAEHPPLNLYELSTICYTTYGRRPSHHTVRKILAEGARQRPAGTTGTTGIPANTAAGTTKIAGMAGTAEGASPTDITASASATSAPREVNAARRFPRYADIPNPEERRLAVIHLHVEGWNAKSIAAYLQTTRTRVHEILRRWAVEGVRGLADKSRAPHQRQRKVTLRALAAIRRLQANPELGEFRMKAALEQLGIHLSARTCGRILAQNRTLYGLVGPNADGRHHHDAHRQKKDMPFAAQRRHQYWTTDIRYFDHPTLGRFYIISILENFSRALLASVLSPRQDLTAFLIVLRAAISQHGAPEAFVSDHGSVFLAKQAQRIYTTLGIVKVEIERRQPWQSYIETAFNVGRRLADWNYLQAETWAELRATHDRFFADYNYQRHFAHERREDGKHSPAEVLGWVHGAWCEERDLERLFHIRSQRRVDRSGYVRFRRWRIYGERGLAGESAAVWLFGETLTLDYQEEPLAQYRVEFEPDEKHLRTMSDAKLFEHRYASPQPVLWEVPDGEWHKAIRLPPPRPRRTSDKDTLPLVQLALFETV